MTTQIDYTCPICKADFKRSGITMLERSYCDLSFIGEGWDFKKGSYALHAYCRHCKKQIFDKEILKELYKGWCG